ncbi:hypothetical protein INT47_011291 [Mucor saturninus]|uniref:Uncharacterized protein n=1 Tax=Mucor saturninus TaxID=64648 RepID=A0A8H7VBY5_9FUNG|nr:hypothetical protein INT47_011291 [Mucor saturninus]
MVVPTIQSYPHYKYITPGKLVRVAPTLAVWGFATAAALALLGSDIPIVRADVLGRIPLAGKYFPVQTGKEEEED